ncbi:hypothetical protein CEXT_414561 [Caerostris extrusa]|uniref:Uncharacterized protein n=1 Tax=Caerostris extrusa TaxID=172846 RepID=A0AAV4VV03_CAEEX|nr:hypothetical protein CEXT_414561 [Caerostris extrusa]
MPILSTSYIQRNRDPWKIGVLMYNCTAQSSCRIPIKIQKSSPTANSTTPIDTHLRVPQQPDNQPPSRSCSFRMLCNTATRGNPKEAILTQESRRSEAGDESSQATRGHHRCLCPVLAALHGSLCCDGSL